LDLATKALFKNNLNSPNYNKLIRKWCNWDRHDDEPIEEEKATRGQGKCIPYLYL